MPRQTLILIRHAEKPDGVAAGIDVNGQQDAESLTPRGWQRAGVWTELFAPSSGQEGLFAKPAAVFASAPESHHETAAGGGHSKSRRPLETVAPLAAKLGIDVDLRFSKGAEAGLAAAVSVLEGTVLVGWQHENIAAIARALTPEPIGIPDKWPEDRFNVVFRLVRDGDQGTAWSFDQLAPIMLQGDVGTLL